MHDALREADSELRRECRMLTRYLTSTEPDEYVISKYVQMQHAVRAETLPVTPVDLALMRSATTSAFGARAADAYARIFRPRGLLRCKLVLAFAILENSPGFHGEFTSGRSDSISRAMARIAVSLLASALALTFGVFLFGPRHLWSRTSGEDGLQ